MLVGSAASIVRGFKFPQLLQDFLSYCDTTELQPKRTLETRLYLTLK